MKLQLQAWWQRRKVRRDHATAIRQLERRLTAVREETLIAEVELQQLKERQQQLEQENQAFHRENDRLQAEVDLIKNVILPESNLAHQLAIARYEADIAVQVKRQAVAS